MTLHQALDASRSLAKHNPFARMTPDEQELANQASAILKKFADTEDLIDLMNNQKWKALF